MPDFVKEVAPFNIAQLVFGWISPVPLTVRIALVIIKQRGRFPLPKCIALMFTSGIYRQTPRMSLDTRPLCGGVEYFNIPPQPLPADAS